MFEKIIYTIIITKIKARIIIKMDVSNDNDFITQL